MKVTANIALGLAVIASGLLAASCTTVRMQTTTNEIKSEKMVLNTFLDRDDWSVIGTATGESDFVYWSDDDDEYKGDSGKYGYIYEPAEPFIGQADNGQKMYVGVGKKLVANPESEALRRAKLNAIYALIEEAYKLGGDSIFEPVYTVETDGERTTSPFGTADGKTKYKVTVRAKVIQIKLQ